MSKFGPLIKPKYFILINKYILRRTKPQTFLGNVFVVKMWWNSCKIIDQDNKITVRKII